MTELNLSDEARALAFCSFGFGEKSSIKYGGFGAKFKPTAQGQRLFDELKAAGMLTEEIVSAGGRLKLSGTKALTELNHNADKERCLEVAANIKMMEPSQ